MKNVSASLKFRHYIKELHAVILMKTVRVIMKIMMVRVIIKIMIRMMMMMVTLSGP